MCCLHQGCLLGACPLWRMLHPQNQPQFHRTSLQPGELDSWELLRAGRLWHHRPLRWHPPSASPLQLPGASLQHHISRQCSHQVRRWSWESHLTPANTGDQHADAHGRQGTQGQDDNTHPTNRSQGEQERFSVRMTGSQMPHQVGECPSGAPHNIPLAPTSESTPPQCGSGMRASPKNPLRNVAKFRSQGQKKDLDHILKAYYKYNFASFKEVEWNRVRDKFFEHLLWCQNEWRSIKKMTPSSTCPTWKNISMPLPASS